MAPTAAQWQAFEATLDGTLVRPGDPAYATAHRLFDPRFDSVHPQGVVRCASEADVQRAIAFATHHGLHFTARSGGHSYGGYSTGHGLVCDLVGLSSIHVHPDLGTAVVGAGARLIDLYAAAAAHGRAIAGGSCPTVGISGVTLGGGQGVLDRRFGLTCDNLRAVRIVTADGAVLTCTENQHADLFWACRGGGGGNFGVATSFTFRVHPLTHLARFFLSWPWSRAAHVVAAWQHWAPDEPDDLWSNCHLRFAVGNPSISVSGVYAGPQASMATEVSHLVHAVGSAPTVNQMATGTYLDTMLIEAGCAGLTVAQCHLPSQNPQGVLGRELQVARSDFFDHSLPPAGIQALLHSIERRGANPLLAGGGGGVGLDALGGAINRVPRDATAFVHRNSRFLAQYSTRWPPGASDQVVDANVAWLDAFHHAMRPFSSGLAYVNYIDPTLTDWQHAYYGANLARLVHVKARYDPGNFFQFPQSIPVA
ncbi:MAG: FAD-binding oxidoreductase [Actinomycetota bacterium]